MMTAATVDVSSLVAAVLGAGGISAAIGVWWKNKVESDKQKMQHEVDLAKLSAEEKQKTLELVREMSNGKTAAIHEMLGKIVENQVRVVEIQLDTARSVGRIATTLESRPCMIQSNPPGTN